MPTMQTLAWDAVDVRRVPPVYDEQWCRVVHHDLRRTMERVVDRIDPDAVLDWYEHALTILVMAYPQLCPR